jgi:hypothetical protein
LRGLTKVYGGRAVVSDVSLAVVRVPVDREH